MVVQIAIGTILILLSTMAAGITFLLLERSLVRFTLWFRKPPHGIRLLVLLGLSILAIDKNVDALTRIADRHHILEKGRIVWTGSSAELRVDPDLQRRYLGV